MVDAIPAPVGPVGAKISSPIELGKEDLLSKSSMFRKSRKQELLQDFESTRSYFVRRRARNLIRSGGSWSVLKSKENIETDRLPKILGSRRSRLKSSEYCISPAEPVTSPTCFRYAKSFSVSNKRKMRLSQTICYFFFPSPPSP